MDESVPVFVDGGLGFKASGLEFSVYSLVHT